MAGYDSLSNQQSQTGSYGPIVGYGGSLQTGTSFSDLNGDYYDPNTGQVVSSYVDASTRAGASDGAFSSNLAQPLRCGAGTRVQLLR